MAQPYTPTPLKDTVLRTPHTADIETILFFDGREPYGDAPLIHHVVAAPGESTGVLAEFARLNWKAKYENQDAPAPDMSDDDVIEAYYAMEGGGIYWRSESTQVTPDAARLLATQVPAF